MIVRVHASGLLGALPESSPWRATLNVMLQRAKRKMVRGGGWSRLWTSSSLGWGWGGCGLRGVSFSEVGHVRDGRGEDLGEVTGSLERPGCPEGLTAGRKGGERGAGRGPGAPAWALVTECFPKGFKEEIPLLPPPSPLHCPQSSPPFITHELFTFQIHLSHFLPLTRPYCQHYPATCVSHLRHVLRHLYLSKARTANVYDGRAANRLHLHRQRSGETRQAPAAWNTTQQVERTQDASRSFHVAGSSAPRKNPRHVKAGVPTKPCT